MNNWHERLDKARVKLTNETYAECKQVELNEKGEITKKDQDKDEINLYSNIVSKIRDDTARYWEWSDHQKAIG